jgi:hypothetical protein
VLRRLADNLDLVVIAAAAVALVVLAVAGD